MGASRTTEVLRIIYKHPRLRPKDVHSKRTMNLSRTTYSILSHMKHGGLIERQENGSYIITDLGISELKRLGETS